jgi:hypothetical protein
MDIKITASCNDNAMFLGTIRQSSGTSSKLLIFLAQAGIYHENGVKLDKREIMLQLMEIAIIVEQYFVR